MKGKYKANVGSTPTKGKDQAGGIYREMDPKLSADMKAVMADYSKDFDETKGMGIPQKPWAPGESNLKAIQSKFGKGAGVD